MGGQLPRLLRAEHRVHQFSSTPVIIQPQGSTAFHSVPQGSTRFEMMIDTLQEAIEERCKFCGGTPRVLTHPKNRHRKPREKKQIWNASNERMLCRGTTTFEASYGDQTTEVLVLVSPDLNDDAVLLGWKALQRLRIIPENFPSPTKTKEDDASVQALTVKIEPLDPTPPDTSPEILPETMPPEILPETMPPDICRKLQPRRRRGEKRRWKSRPAEEGEKRGDGDGYTPAAPWEEMVATMLPFPTLIPVDNNDLKSVALSVDVAGSKTLVAPESAFLIGGDTALTVDVSDLPQRTEGGVTGQTETASRSPSTTRL